MRIHYYISAKGNRLYDGCFLHDGAFAGYGQESFVYDLACQAPAEGITLDVFIDDAQHSPLPLLLPRCVSVKETGTASGNTPDLILLDVVPDDFYEALPKGIPAIQIVHNPAWRFPPAAIARCRSFVCMTANAVKIQLSKGLPARKIVFLTQGVDLDRFESRGSAGSTGSIKECRTLIYMRFEPSRLQTIHTIASAVLGLGMDLTILGDGPGFWDVAAAFGSAATVLSYTPPNSVPRFLSKFDLVISCGRGAMEALACGRPTICAAYGYGGVLSEDRIEELLTYNLTGFGKSPCCENLAAEIDQALALPNTSWRRTAEQHFDVRRFLRVLLEAFRQLQSVS